MSPHKLLDAILKHNLGDRGGGAGGWSWGQNPHFFCPVSQTRSPGEPELAHRVRSSFR